MHVLAAGKLPVTGAALTGSQLPKADKQQSLTDDSPSAKPQVSAWTAHGITTLAVCSTVGKTSDCHGV